MPFTTKTLDKFHIKSNLKSKTVDTFPVTGLFQILLFLTNLNGACTILFIATGLLAIVNIYAIA